MPRKKEELSRYDVTDYLKSEEDIAAYLEACLEEAADDAGYIAAALGDIARTRHGARDAGVIQTSVESSSIAGATRMPSAVT